MKTTFLPLSVIFIPIAMLLSCQDNNDDPVSYPDVDRFSKLPGDIQKQSPETDDHPPILHSNDYETPVPLGPGINSSGGEDSPFILPDGKTLYFFFTPDVRIPVEKQLLDSVTGVYISHKINNEWDTAVRVWLQDPGKLSMDGAVAIQGNEMWFASAREGYTGVNIFIAQWNGEKWADWTYAGDRLMKETCISSIIITNTVS